MLKELIKDSTDFEIKKKVYLLIHEHGPITKAEILKKIKLKQTKLTRVIDELLDKKVISEFGYAESAGGRPPVLYVIEPSCNYLIGIDISRTYTKVILANLLFKEIEKESFTMTEFHTPEKTLSQITEIIFNFLNKRQITIDEVLSIGVGTVGPLDREKGIILNPPLYMNDNWKDVRIIEYLKSKFPVRIILDNGGNAAVVGEYIKSSLSFNNVLYSVSNRGVRCGIFSNGKLVRSKTGEVIAFGHTIVDINGRLCECGKKGCLNTYISLQSIIYDIHTEIKKGTPTILTDLVEDMNDLHIDHIIYALEEEDYLTKKIVSNSAFYYGVGLANLINLFNPELIILSGYLIEKSNFYYESVVKFGLQHIYIGNSNNVVFTKGTLGTDAIVVGATILAFNSYFNII